MSVQTPVWPISASVRPICWLTALGDTPSCSAAFCSDPQRATASTARNPLRCTELSVIDLDFLTLRFGNLD